MKAESLPVDVACEGPRPGGLFHRAKNKNKNPEIGLQKGWALAPICPVPHAEPGCLLFGVMLKISAKAESKNMRQGKNLLPARGFHPGQGEAEQRREQQLGATTTLIRQRHRGSAVHSSARHRSSHGGLGDRRLGRGEARSRTAKKICMEVVTPRETSRSCGRSRPPAIEALRCHQLIPLGTKRSVTARKR